MFGQSINAALSRVGAEQLTDLAIIGMIVLFSAALVLGAFGLCRRFTAQTATLLTSIGILGTFAGIVVGLYGFDSSPGQIDASVQTLLAGLKTAFTSSLVGMALAVTYKLLASAPLFSKGSKEAPQSTTVGLLEALVAAAHRQADETAALRTALGSGPEQTLDDRVSALQRVTERGLGVLTKSAAAERRLLKQQCETLDRLHVSLVDDDEASLSGQLRQLRGELSDRHRTRRAEFETLSRLGETRTETLRGVLEEQRNAAPVRERIEIAITAAEAASRAVAEAVTSELPKVVRACDGIADGANRTNERVERFADRSETLSEAANDTLRQLLGAVGDAASGGLSAQLREIETALAAIDTRIEAQTTDLGARADLEIELGGERLAALREQRSDLQRLVERIGGSEHESLSRSLAELRTTADRTHELQALGFEQLVSLAKDETGLLEDALEIGRSGLDGAERTDRLLRERLEEIVGLLSRSPTEEIIDALKATIREFNEHIAEQFGDNFKQLNEAVGRLLDWQENYREQLDDMRRQYAAGVQAITDTERSVGAILEHSAAIPHNVEKLGDLLAANDAELDQLRAHLAAFAEAREQAVRAVPEITRIVSETVNGLGEAGRSLTTGVQSSAEAMTSSISQSAENYVRATDSVNENVRSIAQRSQEETDRLFTSLQDSILEAYQKASANTEKLVTKEFQDMEEARQKQVENVMREMGEALATITRKFTEDYKKLVAAMDDVVQTKASQDRKAA